MHRDVKLKCGGCSCFLSSSPVSVKARLKHRHHDLRISSVPSVSPSSDWGNDIDSSDKSGRRSRKRRLESLQYRRRRRRWQRRYGSLTALQSTFGRGPPLGDLSPQQTRELYHALLPRSLLALNELNELSSGSSFLGPEELAPLAYEARIAAKEYARSRCVWTGRVGTWLFDNYRSLRHKGKLVAPGRSGSMSWEEIWDKYEEKIVVEEEEEMRQSNSGDGDDSGTNKKKDGKKKALGEDDLARRVYMRILEKSCATNQKFDSLFLVADDDNQNNGVDGEERRMRRRLAAMATQLEDDVRAILLSPKEGKKAAKMVEKSRERTRKSEAKAARKAEKEAKRAARALRKRYEEGE